MKVSNEIASLTKDGTCFGCGERNPVGLKLAFREEGERSRAEFTSEQMHASWAGIFHGGLMVTALDEAIGWVMYYQGIGGMTAKMEVRFRQPVHIGQRLHITGEIVRRSRKLVNARATAQFDDGSIAAEMDATMFVVKLTTGE